jgi:predicted permease
MLLRIVAILLPIFAIVGIGFFYALKQKPDMRVANHLNMDVFVPALVFYALAGKPLDLVNYSSLALAALMVVLGCGLLAWPIARLMGFQHKTFIPPMMFNNAGNIGLPLALLTWGETALPAAIVLFMVENTLHFSLGARWLDTSVRISKLWRVPVVAAAILGLSFNLLSIPIWEPIAISIRMLGEIAVPLMLFSLGVRLATTALGEWKIGVIGGLVCPLSGMLLAVLCIPVFGLEGRDAAMLTVFGALPPAVLNFLFSERYRQQPEQVASIVLIGNLMALFFLPLALYWVL